MRVKISNIGLLKNLSWIFLGNVTHAILQFVLNIFVARVLTTDEYGLINYSASLITFFSAVGTLGFNGVVTKKFAENEHTAGEYLGTAFVARSAYAICAIALLQIIVRRSSPAESLLPHIVLVQSFSILFASGDLLIYWFRYQKQANVVAILRLCAFALSAIWRMVAVAVYHNVVAYVIGATLETCFFIILLFISYHRYYRRNKFSCSMRTFKSLINISYPFICSAVLTTIYGQTDKVMLNSMISSSEVAMYSVALTLAGAISIIPQALIEGFRPEIMRYRVGNMYMYKRRLRQLYAAVFWLCIVYCLVISLAAKPTILLFYGEKYIEAVPVLSLIVWYTSFSFFGAINNIYMVAESKTKWVQLSTLIGALSNIGMNLLLIPTYGATGAAFASLITQIITNFILLLIIPALREDFWILIQGITLRDVWGRN